MVTMHKDMERIDIQDVLIRKPSTQSEQETKFDTLQTSKRGSSSLYDEWAMEKARESQARSRYHQKQQQERRIPQPLVDWPTSEEVGVPNHNLLVGFDTLNVPTISHQRPSFSNHHGHPLHSFNEESLLTGNDSSSPFPSAMDIARSVAASAAAATRDMERGNCDDRGDNIETTDTSRSR